MVVKTTLIRLFILVVLHSKTANTTTTSNFFFACPYKTKKPRRNGCLPHSRKTKAVTRVLGE